MNFNSPVWSNTFRMVAQRYGLIVDNEVHIHGVIDRIPIAIMRAPYMHGGRADAVITSPDDAIYNALLPTSAPFWFNCAEKSEHEKLGSFFKGLFGKASGDAEFDQRFAVHADDPVKVSTMLDDETRGILLKLAKNQLSPLLTAHMLGLRARMGSNDIEPRIETALRDLVAGAHAAARSFMTAWMQSAYR